MYSCSWDRDLVTDLKVLKENFQINTLISLLEEEEYLKLDVANLIDEAMNQGFEFYAFPI